MAMALALALAMALAMAMAGEGLRDRRAAKSCGGARRTARGDEERPELRSRAIPLRRAQGLGAGVVLHPRPLGARDHRLQGRGTRGASARCSRATSCTCPRACDPARGHTRVRAAARGAARRPQPTCLLPRALLAALYRFGATRNVQDVSDAARGVCQSEADRLDSELSMVRYIAWAIPAIGFIGTVRGIGDALGAGTQGGHGRHRPASPKASASRSTRRWSALLISIVLMFLLHQLQLAQERLVLDTETYLDQQPDPAPAGCAETTHDAGPRDQRRRPRAGGATARSCAERARRYAMLDGGGPSPAGGRAARCGAAAARGDSFLAELDTSPLPRPMPAGRDAGGPRATHSSRSSLSPHLGAGARMCCSRAAVVHA